MNTCCQVIWQKVFSALLVGPHACLRLSLTGKTAKKIKKKMVGVLGLEPRSLAAQDFESSVFTNFTILPVWARDAQVRFISLLSYKKQCRK